jgi:hypothetical protein
MGTTNKVSTIILTIIIVTSSLLLAPLANAQTIPKPSVPEFTVKYIDNSYDVPLTTTTDPYTGRTVTQGGYHVNGVPEIEIRIKNTNDTVYYSVRAKGHFSQNWRVVEYWHIINNTGRVYNPPNPYPPKDTRSQFTTLRFGDESNIPAIGQMDFQVEALKGQVTVGGDQDHSALYNMHYPTYDFRGVTSGWSDTQTLTIGLPSIFSLNAIFLISVIIIVAALVTSFVLLLLFRRHRKTANLKK